MLIPLPKDVIVRLSYPTIEEYSNIIMATLFNNLDFSRLLVTANNKKLNLIQQSPPSCIILSYYYYSYLEILAKKKKKKFFFGHLKEDY